MATNFKFNEYIVKIDPKETEKRISEISKSQKNFKEVESSIKASKGNLVSKYPVFRVYHKEAGESTLGGRKIWLDHTIGKLNLDNQGDFLGSFNSDDLILVINEDGSYELNSIDFS